MADRIDVTLRDGTLVRHKMKGYEGKIEGTTAIKACFTRGGALLETPVSKEIFQYRVVVNGESMRYIAPMDDLEILDAATEIVCVRCHQAFYTKPGLTGKAGGRCACGGWICPVCMGCQTEDAAKDKATSCVSQRKRFLKKLASEKK
ncbi:MAG TPA: hypothetical protein VGK77_15745 [Candidatus Binatia bacterium]|jgi:hypothetical protein